MSNVTGVSPAAAEHTLGSQVLGVVVTFVGAAMLALSMSVQRYALAHTEGRVPMLGRTLPRTGAWCVGLALYGVANVCKVLGFQFASFTILASVFTTLLGFNLIFGRWLLKEEITLAKAAGTGFIFIGAEAKQLIGAVTGSSARCVVQCHYPAHIYEGPFIESPPFSKVDDLLRSHGAQRIKWEVLLS